MPDQPTQFVGRNRNKSLQLTHTMVAFEEDTEIQLDPLPAPISGDQIVMIKNGDLEGLVCLVDRMQVNLKYQDDNGFTLLHYAAFRNQPAIMQYLLDSGLNINQIDIEGNTTLHFTIKNGYNEAMECLLNHKGVDTTLVNND